MIPAHNGTVPRMPTRSQKVPCIDIPTNTARRKGKLLILVAAYDRYQKLCSAKLWGRPFPLREKNRPCFWKVLKHVTRKQFKRTFRLTCYQFRVLVGRLRPMLDRNRRMADRASGLLQAEIKIALLLRILSGGSYYDLSLIFIIQTLWHN